MKRWLLGLIALIVLAVVVPLGAGAQGKDTLTVALPSHAPTLDPHMHFERVGILVNINMFDSLLHRSAKLEFEPSLATSWKALNDTAGIVLHYPANQTRRTLEGMIALMEGTTKNPVALLVGPPKDED